MTLDATDEPAWLTEEMNRRGPTEAVAEAGVDGRCARCARSVDLFLGIYGAEAGNWALRTMATAGVYLGGGIARKLLVGGADVRQAWRSRAHEIFLARFLGKGRLRPLLEAMPVRVIVNDRAPLIGAAHRAMKAGGV